MGGVLRRPPAVAGGALSRAVAGAERGSGTRVRAAIAAVLFLGVAVQLASLLFLAREGMPSRFTEDMTPFTYLEATIASVLAAVMAMAGSVLILSLTLGTAVQRSHLGSILLGDADFRLATAGAILTIFASCLALLAAHLPIFSHSALSILLLSTGSVVQFGADVVALERLFRRIPRLLTQETLLDWSLARVDAEYLARQEERLLGPSAPERERADVLGDMVFSYRIYPVESDDPLVTVHDVLENVLSQSPASVAAASLAGVSRRLADLAEGSHDRIFQLLVTPWFAELRVAIVRRGSPSIALAYFDFWADVLEAGKERGLDLFYTQAARPFVTALREVARAGLFEGARERVLRPVVRVLRAGGVDGNAVGPWVGALIVWMREDAEKGDGDFTKVLWNPVENVLEAFALDLAQERPLLDVLVHGLTGALRAAARSGLETGDGHPFALKMARKLGQMQADLEELASREGLGADEALRARRRSRLLGEPVAELVTASGTLPELKGLADLLRAPTPPDDERDGEA